MRVYLSVTWQCMFFYYCVRVCCGNVFTESLPSNGYTRHNMNPIDPVTAISSRAVWFKWYHFWLIWQELGSDLGQYTDYHDRDFCDLCQPLEVNAGTVHSSRLRPLPSQTFQVPRIRSFSHITRHEIKAAVNNMRPDHSEVGVNSKSGCIYVTWGSHLRAEHHSTRNNGCSW
jgi:hypothetical protein